MDLGVDMDEITYNGSNQLPPAAVSALAPSSSLSLYDLQGIVLAVMKYLSPFIAPPALFSSVQL